MGEDPKIMTSANLVKPLSRQTMVLRSLHDIADRTQRAAAALPREQQQAFVEKAIDEVMALVTSLPPEVAALQRQDLIGRSMPFHEDQVIDDDEV